MNKNIAKFADEVDKFFEGKGFSKTITEKSDHLGEYLTISYRGCVWVRIIKRINSHSVSLIKGENQEIYADDVSIFPVITNFIEKHTRSAYAEDNYCLRCDKRCYNGQYCDECTTEVMIEEKSRW